jgi:hypothetical protein
MTSGPLRSRWDHWGLVPGPINFVEPFYSTEMQDPVAEYDVDFIAELTLAIPGVQFTHVATPSWWDWRARWTSEVGGTYIMLEMTLFDATDPPFFGGQRRRKLHTI